jgi:hypothetical protein
MEMEINPGGQTLNKMEDLEMPKAKPLTKLELENLREEFAKASENVATEKSKELTAVIVFSYAAKTLVRSGISKQACKNALSIIIKEINK